MSEYVKKNSISYRTAWRHYKLGVIPNAKKLPTGTIIVEEDISEISGEEYTIIYARVSSSENKSNLDSQTKRLEQFCLAKG